MEFRALIGTVVSNWKATVTFEDLIYKTEHKDEIEMLKKAEWVSVYWVALVEEPKVKKVEEKVEEPSLTVEVQREEIEVSELVSEYERLSWKTVSPRYSKDKSWLENKISELKK